MADDEDYVLTDSLGNEILESEGTTGQYTTLYVKYILCVFIQMF